MRLFIALIFLVWLTVLAAMMWGWNQFPWYVTLILVIVVSVATPDTRSLWFMLTGNWRDKGSASSSDTFSPEPRGRPFRKSGKGLIVLFWVLVLLVVVG